MDHRLTRLQEEFLDNHIKARQHDFYRTNKVKLKGKFIEGASDLARVDEMLDAWVLEEILHGDLGEKPYRCQCGRAVRHLYVVKHQTKDVTLKLGSTCYKDYMGIDGEKFELVSNHHQILVAQREEIIHRYDIGDFELMRFLLDYKDLDPLYREQLSLGLPLSNKQELKAYKDLAIEDESSLVSVRQVLSRLNKKQLSQLNGLTPQARMTVVARLRDGRILGVLDEVLEAAPSLFADRGQSDHQLANRLERRVLERLEKEGIDGQWRQDEVFLKDLDQLITLVKSEVIEGKVLVKAGASLLSQRQRDYWAGRTSFRQKVEISEHLINGSNRVKILPGMVVPRSIRDQINHDLPLTQDQMTQIKSG